MNCVGCGGPLTEANYSVGMGRVCDGCLTTVAAGVPAAAGRRVYRTRTIKRSRRTKAAVDQLDEQIIDVLGEDHPQSVRHVFYRMTDPRLPEPAEKSERGYRAVQHRCVQLRRSGRLPYGWITDATRRGYFVSTFRSAADFLRRTTGLYRADLWQQAEHYVEIWVESRSIAGVIQGVCEELAVSLYPAGGFTSLSQPFEAAGCINAAAAGRAATIFYLGDYDPAGVLIDVQIERELRKHLDPDIVLDFQRIAITPEQIERLDLPTKPRKAGDRRARHVESTVEAESMPAATMRDLLRQHVEALLPENALRIARVAEQSERAHLEHMAELLETRQ